MTLPRETVLERAAHARRGYRLARVQEALLPMALLTVSASIRRPAALGPVEAFVLRTVQADFTTPELVAGVLGLRKSLVESVLVDLWRGDFLVYRQGEQGDRPRLGLLRAGRSHLSDRTAYQTEHVELEVTYDRFLGRIRKVPVAMLLRPKRAREADAIALPAHQLRPEAASLAPHLVEAALSPSIRDDDRFTVVRVTDVLRAEDRFQVALVLTYVSVDEPRRIEQAVLVDDRPSADHDVALSERPEVAWRFRVDDEELRPPPPPQLPARSPVDPDEADRLSSTAQRLQEDLVESRRMIARSGTPGDNRAPANQDDVSGLRRRIDHLEQQLQRIAVRRLSVFDHPGVLLRARTQTQRRLLIISPWIRATVVDRTFVSQLEQLCRRGVVVHIRYGMDDHKPASTADQRAIHDLEALHRRLHGFTVVRGRQTHAKVLVFDDTAVTGSFNWLSFRGDEDRTYRQEESWLVQDARTVDELYETHRREMEAEVPDR